MNLDQMQPHQCFTINCLEMTMTNNFPWNLLQTYLQDIMVFEEKDFKEVHTHCHNHGNAITNYLLSNIPKTLHSAEYSALQSSVIIPLRYRHVWIEVNDCQIKILNKGEVWYASEKDCKQKSLVQQPDILQYSLVSKQKKIILSMESACACLLGKTHDLLCSCLCHCRPCTHILNN